jgi:hypothetical protein
MDINIIYSKDNEEHLKTALLVRKAVKNLGIRANITETEAAMPSVKVVVNGFDLLNSGGDKAGRSGSPVSYTYIENALERTAWASY